jgi:8-oxo-dGTP diphosphatase
MKNSGKKRFCYDYPRPAVTVDVVVVSRKQPRRVLLIRRKHEPFASMWAVPGGFIAMDEALETAARRELMEETGIRAGRLEQLGTFGDVTRDPRGRTIGVVYLAEVDADNVEPRASDDAAAAAWHSLARLPPLAFDHAAILACARERLRSKRTSRA